MRRRLLLLVVSLTIPACGGGGGGGSNATPNPNPPLATTVNTGLAVSPGFTAPAALDRYLAASVREQAMNEDRNGDGDMDDDVLVCIDTETDAITNLGQAVTGPILTSGIHFAYLVVEADDGRVDLNLDGDILDAVWFVYDPAQPPSVVNPINTGIATPALGTAAAGTEGGFVFLESETAQGLLLNGDVDMNDHVIAVFDDTLKAIVAVGAWTYAPGTPLVARNGRVLVALGEPSAAADFNRDADTIDIVLVCVDFTVPPTVLHPVGGVNPRAVGSNPYALTDDAAVYLVDEASEGNTDLNNDGDTADGIIAVFNMANGFGERFPFSPLLISLATAGSRVVGISTSADRAVLAVDESDQRGRDLNNDMDAFDNILAWVDTSNAPGSLHILPYALGPNAPAASGHRALVEVDEMASGAIIGVDHNGDTDTDDRVAFLLEMDQTPGVVTNLGFAQTMMDLRGADALLGVTEAGHFGIDMNGNGRTDDIVRVYFDVGDNAPTMRALGIIATSATFFRVAPDEVRIAALVPEGQSPTFDDINEDGDSTDSALILLGLDPSESPPGTHSSTPFFAGTGGFFPVPPVRVNADAFAFPTMELLAGTDLNNDGDTQDTILSYCKYN